MDEQQLVERFNAQNEQAYNEVFKLYNRQLCYYCRLCFTLTREDCEDLVLEVFVQLFKSVKKGKKFETLKHIKDFLFVSAYNAAINHLRSSKRQADHLESFFTIAGQNETSDDFNNRVETEMLQIIFSAVEKLPSECKRIFKMLYIEGLSYQDIAIELDLSVQTVRNQKSRAIMLLRKHIFKPIVLITCLFSLAR